MVRDEKGRFLTGRAISGDGRYCWSTATLVRRAAMARETRTMRGR
jgi:hypothetical protein